MVCVDMAHICAPRLSAAIIHHWPNMASSGQAELARLWKHAPRGRMSPWTEASAWGLREGWRSSHQGSAYGMLSTATHEVSPGPYPGILLRARTACSRGVAHLAEKLHRHGLGERVHINRFAFFFPSKPGLQGRPGGSPGTIVFFHLSFCLGDRRGVKPGVF